MTQSSPGPSKRRNQPAASSGRGLPALDGWAVVLTQSAIPIRAAGFGMVRRKDHGLDGKARRRTRMRPGFAGIEDSLATRLDAGEAAEHQSRANFLLQ